MYNTQLSDQLINHQDSNSAFVQNFANAKPVSIVCADVFAHSTKRSDDTRGGGEGGARARSGRTMGAGLPPSCQHAGTNHQPSTH